METIKINVNKQMDGYTFSITPSIRQLIKEWFPKAHPANNIFVAYDTKSDFDFYHGEFKKYIYPVLLGIGDQNDINKKIDEIQFIDTQTGSVYTHKVTT